MKKVLVDRKSDNNNPKKNNNNNVHGDWGPVSESKDSCSAANIQGGPKIVSYRTLSISSLNIDRFSHFFSPVDSVRNLLLTGMCITPTMSLHYLVKHKYPKICNIIYSRRSNGKLMYSKIVQII